MVELSRLRRLANGLKSCAHPHDRLMLLNGEIREQGKVLSSPLATFLACLSLECEIILKSLIVIGQEQCLFVEQDVLWPAEQLRLLIEALVPVEQFYKEMGGVVGYHVQILSLIRDVDPTDQGKKDWIVSRPDGVDISSETSTVRRSIVVGLCSLPLMAEVYPVGGAADRLRFCEPLTRHPLPAAKLPFCGRSLLETLILDVVGKEYLYYKLFDVQLTTPIALMTSFEKHNHDQILELCHANSWFGRPEDSIRLFSQPLVPVLDREGMWCLQEGSKLVMKPGGHGVLWKLALDQGVFAWLEKLGRKKILVRQINNPIAGIDYGLLAFCGIGVQEEKAFGFASCERQVGSAEGMDLLIEQTDPISMRKEYCLTNVEYCDFQKFGIEDHPLDAESCYSRYPSNTNVLFADIGAIKEKVGVCPLPGMVVNWKQIQLVDGQGGICEKVVARLESTMQNIADCFVGEEPHQLPTFLTYHRRHKMISATKRAFQLGGSLLETPEGCYYDLLQNAHALLTEECHFILPPLQRPEEYIQEGPSFIFHYHPALGPLYHIIAQKVQGGEMALGSECVLDIAEIEVRNLYLDGSLHIVAEDCVGSIEGGRLKYSERVGRCQLHHVRVENRGVDRDASLCFWKGEVKHKERCAILIHGDGEFYASHVVFCGDVLIEVEAGSCVTAFMEEGKVCYRKEMKHAPLWRWEYQLKDNDYIQLEKKKATESLLLPCMSVCAP